MYLYMFYANDASFLDEACLVKIDGYWRCSSLVDLMHDLDWTSAYGNELGKYLAILILCLAPVHVSSV